MSNADRDARLHAQAQALAERINRRLERAGVQHGSYAVARIVEEEAPGWRFTDATTHRDRSAVIVLTAYEGDDR